MEIIESEPERLEALWENTAYLSKCIKEIGFDTKSSETPIIPIYIRDNLLTFQFTQRLFEAGVFVNPVVSPAVPGDSSLIRMSVMATHTRSQLDEAVGAIEKIASVLQVFALKN